jgi:uncharacterized protein
MTMHVSVSIVVQHLLFVFLLVIAPAWDLYDTRRLKAKPSSSAKICYYKTLCSWLWGGTVVACLALGWRPLFTIHPAPEEMGWLLLYARVRYLVLGIVLAIFLLNVAIPAWLVFWKKLKNEPRRYSSAEAFKGFNYFFPATWVERHWFAFVSITAGICEEVLFRGFLLHYLHVSPFRLSLTLALVISSVIFGANHLYTGMVGVAANSGVGFLIGLLFVLSGSLVVPIVFHALMDLRMLLVLRPPE